GGLDAVHVAAQARVHEHEIGPELAGAGHRVGPGGGGSDHLVAELPQGALHIAGGLPRVPDDEDAMPGLDVVVLLGALHVEPGHDMAADRVPRRRRHPGALRDRRAARPWPFAPDGLDAPPETGAVRPP